MRIAVTSTGPTMDSPVDTHFGRAGYILIVDPEAGLLEALDNHDNLNAAQGAGINAAQTVSEHGAEWVLTGHVGPKAFAALEAAGVRVASGASADQTCSHAIERFKRGDLAPADQPDVKSHWG